MSCERGMAPPPRRFVETEETFHFFNEDVVLGTNEIRSGDVSSSSSSDSDSSEASRLRRARRRRRASSVVSRRTSRRLSRLLNGSVVSELESLQEGALSDSDEDDYDSLDDFELEEEGDEEIHRIRERKESTDNADAEPQNTAPAATVAGTKVPGVGAATFEQIFEPFRDLYIPPTSVARAGDNGDWMQSKKRPMRQQMQLRSARRAIAAFTRRVHCANAYRYRKKSEFMRVCYQRALEGGPGYELTETAKEEICGGGKTNEAKKQALLQASQKEDAVETTVPNLFPRKWPHLPYRSPLQWHNDTDAAIEFLSRLAELPETSLIYEPIDAGKFTAEVAELLELSQSERTSAVSEPVFAGLLGLLAMGVQLQSFTLLSKAALQFIELGQATYLGDKEIKSDESVRPELLKLLELYCSRLAQHVAEPILAATFPRDLSAQWKVCSYQPSTSDAIATDGLYLYAFGRSGLFKIGTGNGTTVRDFVYAHNKKYVRSRDAERSWLCCIGDSLYCRTIVMPGHRVDRISTNNIQNVQELVLAPNCALIGKGTTESSVYAMVTDGVDLFTVRCIDTYKKSSSGKSSNSHKHRTRSHKSRKSTPMSEIASAVLGKTDSDPKSPPQSPEAVTIKVGDRVVRGPDWKWSNQDGENGSLGTVERISTWGGVKGSGVTVRWDTNQRVNTYRWGAEGCYDLYIVVEKDGQILERKRLPNDKSPRKSKNGERTTEIDCENEPEPLPRHQFVLYRHKVDNITSIMKLEEPDIDLFLDLTPSADQRKQGFNGSSGDTDAQSGVEILSALHSHTVTLCASKTSWMCDGGMSHCFGDNAAKRYRCTSRCDFDLCESCLFATVIDKPSTSKATSKGTAADDGASSVPNATSGDTVPSADDGSVANNVDAPAESIASEGVDPFSAVDVSLFAESEREASSKKKEEKQMQQTEVQLVNDLAEFWCGLYTRKECQVALRRTGLQLNEASTWLHTCGAYLREPMVVPTVSSVVLAAKYKSGALDPVLLIAGTFYATHGQLCVVSPPGLYSVGEEHSDKTKRAANSCDASWFFSLENGSLLTDKPVLLKGIPAGSPTCVDMTRKRILVFSGYLNCLEEYVDHVQQNRQLEEHAITEGATLADTGKLIISQLAQLMRKRAAFPAFKNLRAGLQDILFRAGREPAPGSTEKPPDKDADMGTKSKNRRIRNIRARLKELDRLHIKDRPGHIIPFCVDFEDEGLLQILRAITYYCKMLPPKDADFDESHSPQAPTGTNRLVADLFCILTETVHEFEFVGVTMKIDASDEVTQELFKETERTLTDIANHIFGGQMSDTTDAVSQSERSEIVLSAHFLLVWGIRKGLFCLSCRSEFFVSTCEDVIGSGTPLQVSENTQNVPDLPELFFAILLAPRDSLVLQTKRDCSVDLLRRLLYSPMDDGRIAIADFVPTEAADFSRFLEVLFALSKLESNTSAQREKWVLNVAGLPFQTPVSKALHSVMNYCCARMYVVNVELTPTKSFKEVGQEVLEATVAFESFAQACFDCSLEIIRCYQETVRSGSNDASRGCDLQTSVVGTILPMVIAFIPNLPDHFSDEFRDHLLALMKTVDNLIYLDESSRVARPRAALNDTAIFGGYQVVETPHPYNHSQPVFRRVVHIPGASVLHFEFDPRCRTSGEADIVCIMSGLAWYQADRLPYGDIGFGEDGGCFFGSYLRGNWPAGGLTVVGDTATVMLCATTQGRSGTGDKQRWGLKCTVRGLFGSPRTTWLSDLGCAVANACGVIGDKLLRGLPSLGVEKACHPWVMQRQLFNLAAPTCNVLKSKWKFVDDVANRTERGYTFFSTLSKYVRLRTLPPRHYTARWTESVQEAAAVLLVRSNYRQLDAWLTSVDNQAVLPNDIENALFHRIAVELGKLERWMLRQVQLVSEWHYLCMDEVSLDELMERYADNLDQLFELCQLKSVEFKKNDTTSCVKSIHELVVKEIAAQEEKDATACNQSSSSHEAVAQAVSAKACFLLARWKQCVEYGSTSLESLSEPIYSAVPECLSDVGKFLCSTVSISALEECSTAHSARLESRSAGVGYCKEAIANLKNDAMAQFFVGRVLNAVPSSNLVQDDAIFSGCALASPHLLANIMVALNSYAKTIARVLESENGLPVSRAVALADIWNCAHSLDSMSSRVLGLERVSKMIMALDGEMNSCAEERTTDAGALLCRLPDAHEVHGQVYDIAWIVLRLLVEEIFDNGAEEGALDISWKLPLEKSCGQLCALYKYFVAKTKKQRTHVSMNRHYITISPDGAIYRLVCTVVSKVAVLHEWPEVFSWWVQNAINLVAASNAPLNLSVASTRLIRYALKLLGDSMYDIDVTIDEQTSVLGMQIQDIFLKRVGEIVSPLPICDSAAKTVPCLSDSMRDKDSDHCVVIFRNEVAIDKLVDTANSVGEPDISSLKIPVEVSDGKDAVEKAITEAVAECTGAQATMKHPSVRCDGCNQSPLRGFRFKCFTCPNYDLCTSCYMNQTHNMDHPFVRLTDSTGAGDLLQPRSKGGGVVPETALVGSKPWKGNLLRVLLDSHGYVVYCFGARRECCDTANALAHLGFLVTVAHTDDVADVDTLHDWERRMQLSFEPGSSRLSHRHSSLSTAKSSAKRAGRDIINAFNRKAAVVNSKTRRSGQKVEDGRNLASELIAVVRLLTSSRSNMQRWRNSTLRKLTGILEDSPRQLNRTTGLDFVPCDAYFLTLGATQVLGGFREPLRIGGNVSLSSFAAAKGRCGHTGVVYSYGFGNDDVVIANLDGFAEGARNGEAGSDDDICFCKRTTSEVKATSGVPLNKTTVESLEPLVVSFCSVVKHIYDWTCDDKNDDVDEFGAPSAGSLLRWELACALIQSFSSMAPAWPSLFDNQVISTNGNCPAILFQLAQMCVRDLKVEDIADMRGLLWNMEWLRSRDLHFSLATRPISPSSFSANDKTCVLRPPISALEDPSSFTSIASDGSEAVPEPSEYFYNLYAFSSRADLPQHSGRNKMLEYWEKNVIPAIETYVSGSFKSYEMDYFFAQLREPLREGNAAAALKIAFTLCDGHVPSGCHYPDPDTDWSALQIDDVEVGGRYVIASENVDVADWSRDMLWTLGHSGTVRVVDPSGMVLLQVANPVSSASEYWWYHVDNLRSVSSVTSVTDQSVTDFEASRLRLKVMNQQLIYSIARKSVFDLLQVAPEHAMKMSIETRKTSLARTSSSPLPLPSSSSITHTPTATMRLAAPLPKDLGNQYDLADLLRLAAAADLGCPEKVLSSEMGIMSDSTPGPPTENGGSLYLRSKNSPKTALIMVLQTVLNKQFERAAASPPPPVMDRSTSYDENASVMVTMPAKKHKKRGKQGALAGKLAAVGASSVATSASSCSAPLSSGSSSSLKSTQPKLQQPDVTPALSTRKYRYLLMEALLAELKSSLDLSGAFLRSRSFMVTSDGPPQPLVLIHVPDATCLVLSFAVHPVLMDLPAGSSLEFFRDERCTDRLFGYFGDKRGLSYLPPLVVPGDKCYVRMSQGTYARYKFRVDAFTADFGLALWLCEEIYQKLLSVQLSHYEVETILTTVLNALVEYLVATSACLPSNAKTAVYQITAKLINFALSKGAMHAVPIAKLSGLVKELTFVYDNERTTQKGLYSLYVQQLAELIALVEEVSSMKGGSSSILGGAWWKEFVRMAVFTRVLAQGKREIATPDAFKRIYCGRAPIREIQRAHTGLASHDLFGERIIFLQNLPRTSNVADLEASVSRFIVHLALEECGEADDQNVYSAAAVTRFGIVSNILHMPIDTEGQTMGYAMIDIGRADVIANLLDRIPKESFKFEGGFPTEEDRDLLTKIEAVCRPPDSTSGRSNDGSDSCSGDGADPSDDVWVCSMCTLENSLVDAECAACGSPIPPEMANLAQEVQAQSQSATAEQPASRSEDSASSGWVCTTCTFVNSWADTTCDACTVERSADLVPPLQTSPAAREDSNQDEGDPVASGAGTAAVSHYKLSAARFVEMIRVAEDTSEVPEQVNNFLQHRLFKNTSSIETVAASDGGNISNMTPELLRVLHQETVRYSSSSDSKEAAIEAFASLADVKKNSSWDNLSGEERVRKLTSVKAMSEVAGKALAVYKWLRSSGYDLQFELSHYGSMDDAIKAQAKWTHQMDCQLIAVCRDLSGKLGVLMLTDLCPSHLNASHAREYSLLASLETRDLRLRFSVLQALNKLLVGVLPLVNLRPWSDPSSLRSRIVSMRQLIFPGVKIRFFAQTQDNTTLAHSFFVDTNAKRPMVTLDRRKIAGKRGGISSCVTEASTSLSALRDPKRSLFASTMKQLSAISPSLLRARRPTGASDPFVSFIVIFAGENVVGEGGPYRQLFNDISNELLASGNPLFIPTQNNIMKAGEFRERYMPKPSTTSKELLQMFEFAGILMGCCLRTGVRLNLRLAPLVWKMLVKQKLVLVDLESVDHSLCESLKFLEELASSPSDDPNEILYDSFTTTLSDGTVVELKTGGQHLPVTKVNVKEYIRLVKATRLQECKPQVDAMMRGLGKIVPVQLLQLCVWSELQQWVSGSLEIDIELLKRHTRYSSGMSPEQFPHLETFWKVLSSFSEENKRRFINFAWGQDTLPADDAEFDRTHTRLLIKAPAQDNGVNQDALLPKADTCFFNIELPVYSSEEIMREKLLLAITLCTSLDGDEQTAGHDIYYAGDEMDGDGME
ncbi:E3 ubiquitin-protein ligase mib1 [Phytophthora pseudosyringae]|uniref:E3 ubiquitin-protein ligase mib1 n=1 Tax=Phytophthora pseudosyringae TaxID=221518 RepID=A0A8T1WLA9_9STRA|nr:E3 ubiquitin-protein ligase mib1 [Phytophthora pseudosyringae]